MSQQLNPYITFNGNCAEAMTFYGEAFGVTPTFMKFRDAGMDVDGIMHAQVDTEQGFHLFASDFVEGMGTYNPGTNVQVSLSGDDEADLKRYWEALSAGGQITMPLEKQMWGAEYGQFVDKFGIIWHVNIGG